jgi:mucin-19
MAQGDYLIQNQSFPSFRSDLNSTLEAINTSNSGTSRPSSAVAGTIWLDTTSASTPTLKFYDGSDDISLATLDYTANTVNWLDSTVSVNIVSDTTPQLGGDLDVNGNDIVSVANGNITITPDGTGKVIVDGLSYPTADGTANQVLTTDGAGNLSFADASGGGISWQSTIVTGTTLSAVAGNGYWIDTTSNACTVTLPASASVGDTIEFVDYARNWQTNNLTLNRNGLNFQGGTENPVYDIEGQSVRIVYSGATQGWIPTVDDDVTNEGIIPTYSADFLVIAGGGSGGKCSQVANSEGGGGGGAGGYRTSTQTLTSGNTITVTVGDGGAGITASNTQGNNGSDSSISGTGLTTITSAGGGGGGQIGSTGNSGGSGGGGGSGDPAGGAGGGNTPSTSPSQGNDGGNGAAGGDGGGGGGAGANGQNAHTSPGDAGIGGDGLASSITGSSVTRAGGGGGGADTGGEGGGGAGGGGNGGTDGLDAQSGTANTGSGGGGAGRNNDSGGGGKGVVIISVPTADYSGTTTGSPTISVSGSNTIMQFNGSGSYTA